MSRLGAMQYWPLRVMTLVNHAEREHGDGEIVSAWADGTTTRSNWREIAADARRMAKALEAWDIKVGDRVATLAMNHLLLHLIRTPITEIGIPQKVQAYMAAGRPIIAAVTGEAARLVHEAECGLVCAPSNPHDIAGTILKAEHLLPERLDEMGVRGREFYRQHLSFNHGVKKVKDLIDLMLQR